MPPECRTASPKWYWVQAEIGYLRDYTVSHHNSFVSRYLSTLQQLGFLTRVVQGKTVWTEILDFIGCYVISVNERR